MKLFKEAPLLEVLAKAREDVTQYNGNVQVAQSTSKPYDAPLQAIQDKLRSSMLQLVETEEFDDVDVCFGAAVFHRSAYEDVLQLHRKTAAGRSAAKLDPRTDNPKASLVTAEEKKKLASGGSK